MKQKTKEIFNLSAWILVMLLAIVAGAGLLEMWKMIDIRDLEIQQLQKKIDDLTPEPSGGFELPVGAPQGVPIELDQYARATSPFDIRRSPFNNNRIVFHPGVDLAGTWNGPVLATAGGTISEHWPAPSRYFKGHPVYGGMVKIDHGNGWVTLYAHMRDTYVHEGDVVAEGQIIGRMGESGQAKGVHLHYEVFEEGVRRNPVAYWTGVVIGDDGYIREE